MSRDIFIFNNRNNPAEGYYQVTEEELQVYKKSYDGKSSLCGTDRERNRWWKFLMESMGEDRS